MASVALQKKMNQNMTQLQIKSDGHVRQMLLERKRLEDLEDAVKQADEQIKAFRLETKATGVNILSQYKLLQPKDEQQRCTVVTRADGADVGRTAEQRQKKLLALLDHKLDKLKIRLSQTEHQNESLKTEINSLRRHRMTADKNRASIEAAIRRTQREARATLDKSQQVSEAREKLVEELRDLHKKQADEREHFIAEMKDYAAFIEQQNREFEESLTAAAATTTKPGDVDDEEFFITRGSMTIEEEKMKMELVCEIESQLAAERDATTQTEKKITKYRESFDELKRVSGIFDIKEIVQQYVKSEEETFSLFNYIQALNQETDWTLERHARLEEEIRAYEDKLSDEEAQRTEAMATLQGKWRNAKEATDECSHAAQEAQRTLDRIAKKVQSLFFKIQCDQPKSPTTKAPLTPSGSRPDSQNRLAILSGQGVTESNILAYAELIERRALEIMSDYVRRTTPNPIDQRRRCAAVLDPSRSLKGTHDVVKPPDVEAGGGGGDDDDNEDDDSRPIALDEMRRRTAEMLAKKQHMTRLPSKRQVKPLPGTPAGPRSPGPK